MVSSPAENAATVREALDFSKGVTGPEQIQEALVALAALLAQAEAGTAARKPFSTTMKIMDERDAAVREREQAREALRAADEAFAWLVTNHPKAIRELPTGLYRNLRASAALTGEGTEPEGKYGDWRDNPGNYGE